MSALLRRRGTVAEEERISRPERWLVGTLTIAFGVVPATILVMFAAAMLSAAVRALFEPGEYDLVRALIAIPMSTMGIVGYCALMKAAGGSVTGKVVIGLCLGVVANVYAAFVMADMSPIALDDWYVLYAPIVTGGGHIARYLVRRGI